MCGERRRSGWVGREVVGREAEGWCGREKNKEKKRKASGREEDVLSLKTLKHRPKDARPCVCASLVGACRRTPVGRCLLLSTFVGWLRDPFVCVCASIPVCVSLLPTGCVPLLSTLVGVRLMIPFGVRVCRLRLLSVCACLLHCVCMLLPSPWGVPRLLFPSAPSSRWWSLRLPQQTECVIWFVLEFVSKKSNLSKQ